jgi:hypothetical protein
MESAPTVIPCLLSGARHHRRDLRSHPAKTAAVAAAREATTVEAPEPAAPTEAPEAMLGTTAEALELTVYSLTGEAALTKSAARVRDRSAVETARSARFESVAVDDPMAVPMVVDVEAIDVHVVPVLMPAPGHPACHPPCAHRWPHHGPHQGSQKGPTPQPKPQPQPKSMSQSKTAPSP